MNLTESLNQKECAAFKSAEEWKLISKGKQMVEDTLPFTIDPPPSRFVDSMAIFVGRPNLRDKILRQY